MLRMIRAAEPFVSEREWGLQEPFVRAADRLIREGTGAGGEFLGWLRLPGDLVRTGIGRILEAGMEIRDRSDLVVVVGIGGSYLGTRATLTLLRHSLLECLPARRGEPRVLFAGHNLSGTYLADLLEVLDHGEVSVIVVSKSGTTTEPALAFRVLQDYMRRRYGMPGAASRIYAVTDARKGALRSLSGQFGYSAFEIPDDVGGRFSVLTPVGLLPLAAAGVDVEGLVSGAAQAESALLTASPQDNAAYRYAAVRNALRQKGKLVELFVSYEPGLHHVGAWWQQLFGESEGKDGKGIFPVSADFSTDLHSLGQFVQDGSRILFETTLKVAGPRRDVAIESLAGDPDGLNYLSGRTFGAVNDTALEATVLAHEAGGVPGVVFEMDGMTAPALGFLFYFFELACAASGYLLGVNPFDQPGVEGYKTNMFALLGKPGYDEIRERLAARVVPGDGTEKRG